MKNVLLALTLLAAGSPAFAWERLEGAHSGVKDFHTQVVADAQAWKDLWARHAPSQPVPAVDFAEEQVVAVFLGATPSAGVKVDLKVMSDPLDTARLLVLYRSVASSRSFAAAVVCHPFALVKTRRAEKTLIENDVLMTIPEGSGRAVSNPVDERRMGILLDGISTQSFDGR